MDTFYCYLNCIRVQIRCSLIVLDNKFRLYRGKYPGFDRSTDVYQMSYCRYATQLWYGSFVIIIILKNSSSEFSCLHNVSAVIFDLYKKSQRQNPYTKNYKNDFKYSSLKAGPRNHLLSTLIPSVFDGHFGNIIYLLLCILCYHNNDEIYRGKLWNWNTLNSVCTFYLYNIIFDQDYQ